MSEEKTIFHKILNKEIPSECVYEDEFVYAFKDITPQAPFHCLVIPKKMQGLVSLMDATDEHEAILGKLMVATARIAKEQKLEKGYRTVINSGAEPGQTVFYLHVHVLAGRNFTWPPG